MRATARLGAMRVRASGTFLDTFAAYEFTTSVVDGLDTRAWELADTTPGKIAGPSSATRDTQTRTVVVNGTERLVIAGGLHIPISAELPSVGWEYVCTAVGADSDPALLGRRFRVVDVPAKSYATARRLDVVEVPGED